MMFANDVGMAASPTGIPAASWDWAPVAGVVTSAAFALIVFLQGVLWRRTRSRAWPDRLNDLLKEFDPWTPVRVAGLFLGIALLVLGVARIGNGFTPFSALATGVSLLVLAHRRWSAGSAFLGAVLVSLAVCSGVVIAAHQIVRAGNWNDPIQWGCALGGMAAMVFFWDWLAQVWHQQLRDGQAWTTAGRMIAPGRWLTLTLAAAALGIAGFLLARPVGSAEDGGGVPSGGPMVIAAAMGLVTLALAQRALARREKFLGTMSALAAAETGALLLLRL